MTESDMIEHQRGHDRWPLATVVLGLLALLLAGLSLYLFEHDRTPANDSADVGFARDMSAHHAQAVEMADIVYRRTEDPDIARLALDIGTTQQFQIGMMTGWLDIWGRSVSSDLPPMGWMGDYDMALPSPPPGFGQSSAMDDMNHAAAPETGTEMSLMPGMATRSQVDELNTLPPEEMDIRFLQLMIRHHQGGVMMAHAAMAKTENAHVRNFAQQVIATQDAEIATMTTMLNERLAAADSAPPTSPGTPSPAATPAVATPADSTGYRADANNAPYGIRVNHRGGKASYPRTGERFGEGIPDDPAVFIRIPYE